MLTRRWIMSDEGNYPYTMYKDNRGISDKVLVLYLQECYKEFKNKIINNLSDNMIKFINRLKVLLSSKSVTTHKEINHINCRLLNLIKEVYENKNKDISLGLMSSIIISTCSYHMMLLYKDNLDGFNINKLEIMY